MSSEVDRGQRIDGLTVIAIAVIAYAAANITHEIFGHCGMALVMGTPCTVVSSFYAPLDVFPARWKYNIIVVAGCTANFLVALICLVMLRKSRPQEADAGRQDAQHIGTSSDRAHTTSITLPPLPAALRSMLWLLMAVNLFLASSYIMSAPIIKFGDSYILIQDLSPQIFWRPVVTLAGAIALWFSFRVCRLELARLIGAKGRAARAIAWQLVVTAYLTGGVVWVASALFSRLDWQIAQLQAAGGSFGLTIWLLLLPLFLPNIETAGREPLVIPRSFGWIIGGVLTALFFVGVWGRGIDV